MITANSNIAYSLKYLHILKIKILILKLLIF